MGGIKTSPSLLPLVGINPERLPSDFTDRLGRPILGNGAFGFGGLGPSRIAPSPQQQPVKAPPVIVPKPGDGKIPSRDKDRCLEERLDARAAQERLDAVGAAVRFKQSQIEGFEAELFRLIKEIGLLKMDIATSGLTIGKALGKRKTRPQAAVEAAKAGAQSRKLNQTEDKMRGVQRTIAELKKEKEKLEDQEKARRKDSTAANAKLKACQDRHGDKA